MRTRGAQRTTSVDSCNTSSTSRGSLPQSAANSSGLFWSPYGANQFALSYGLNGGWPAPMTVDEVRIANLMRSPGWIATEFNNQNSPSSFYRFASQ